MSSPLGALPRLSPSARRALWLTGALSATHAVALIVQAWALATALAAVVTTGVGPASVSTPLGVLAGAIVARAVFGWLTETVSARAAAGAKEELRAALLDSALHRGPEWIHRYGPAGLTTLATKGLDALDAYFTRYLPALVTAAIVPPMVGAWILFSDWVSALAIVITVPLIPLFAWLVGRYTEKRTARAADAVQRLSGHLLELVRALPVLTAFGRAGQQGEAVRRVSEAHRRTTVSTLRIAFLSALVLELFSSLSVALVAVGIGLRLISGDLDLATGLLVLVLAPECYLPLRAAGAAHHASEDGVEAVRRVDEVVSGKAGSNPTYHSRPPEGGVLRVEGLRVARRGGYAPDGLSFRAHPGEILHLDGFDGIGPSGSGKSTAFAVLLGFAAPSDGSVTYGGAEVTELDPAQWRQMLAWVPQRPVFTGGTVADELALAMSDQPGHGETDLCEVLDEAAAGHLVDRRVDELSTGERQRIAVARALLRLRGEARILLLDEPTAHLDASTAAMVYGAVNRAAERGAIVVLASHRPETVTAAPEAARTDEPRVDSALPTARGRLRDLVAPRSLLGVALGALSLLAGLALTATSAWLIARASQQPPILTLSVAVVGVRTFALSRAALRYVERLVTHDAAFRRVGLLRTRLWDALVALGPVRSAAFRRGDGVARLVDDVDTVRDLVPRVLVPPLIAAVVALGAVTVQAIVLPSAGVLLAVALAVAGFAAPAVAVFAERRATTAVAEGRRRVASRVLGLLDASAELLAFGAHTSRRAELATDDAHLAARARRAAFGAGAASAVVTLAVGVAVLGGAWLGARAVVEGRLAPELAPLLALVPLAAAEAVATLPAAAQQWRSLRAAQARLAPLLALAPESRDGTEDAGVVSGGAAALAHQDGKAVASQGGGQPGGNGVGHTEGSYGGAAPDDAPSDSVVPGGVERRNNAELHNSAGHRVDGAEPSGVVLDAVDVRWPGAAEPALRDVRLRVPEGARVAVVGPSGGGKSTLLALLLGFLQPERGVVSVPQRVTWCPQEPQLVSTTIRENLRLADPHAGDRRCTEVLRLAGLPGWGDRLDDVLGTAGATLSGGEAQRLALARALLMEDAGLVLLDEPTAHLDIATSEALLTRLNRALRGVTVVHVTHRWSEAVAADIVISVDDGRVTVVQDALSREIDVQPADCHFLQWVPTGENPPVPGRSV